MGHAWIPASIGLTLLLGGAEPALAQGTFIVNQDQSTPAFATNNNPAPCYTTEFGSAFLNGNSGITAHSEAGMNGTGSDPSCEVTSTGAATGGGRLHLLQDAGIFGEPHVFCAILLLHQEVVRTGDASNVSTMGAHLEVKKFDAGSMTVLRVLERQLATTGQGPEESLSDTIECQREFVARLGDDFVAETANASTGHLGGVGTTSASGFGTLSVEFGACTFGFDTCPIDFDERGPGAVPALSNVGLGTLIALLCAIGAWSVGLGDATTRHTRTFATLAMMVDSNAVTSSIAIRDGTSDSVESRVMPPTDGRRTHSVRRADPSVR
jgi:hypothetical protein